MRNSGLGLPKQLRSVSPWIALRGYILFRGLGLGLGV